MGAATRNGEIGEQAAIVQFPMESLSKLNKITGFFEERMPLIEQFCWISALGVRFGKVRHFPSCGREEIVSHHNMKYFFRKKKMRTEARFASERF